MEAQQLQTEQTFQYRYWEYLRTQNLASEIGKVALNGYEKRRYDEITSGLAEALKGIISTEYSFSAQDGKLRAEDGEAVEDLLSRGLKKDKTLSMEDKFYEPFLVARTMHELDELQEQESMARGQRNFNTIITFSPYSEEYASSQANEAKLIVANQKPYWQRGMVRVSHWDGNFLHISTRSVDNSSVNLFRETAAETLNYEFEASNSTGMLGERIHLNMEVGSSSVLADKITDTADNLLGEVKGGSWRQGRPEYEAKELQPFVESQREILEEIFKVDRHLAHQHSDFESYASNFDDLIYNYVSLLKRELHDNQAEGIVDIPQAAVSAGNMNRAAGIVHDMCGYLLKPGTTEAEAAHRTGFESIARLLGQEFESKYCPNCLPVPKAGKKVKAWQRGDHLGCKNCGHVVDICTKKVVSRGRKSKAQQPKSWLW